MSTHRKFQRSKEEKRLRNLARVALAQVTLEDPELRVFFGAAPHGSYLA